MANLEDILKVELPQLPPHPVAIVVDTAMMQHLIDRIPIGRGKLGSIDGVPVYIDDTIGLNRGYIKYSDGHFEKFGSWPKKLEQSDAP